MAPVSGHLIEGRTGALPLPIDCTKAPYVSTVGLARRTFVYSNSTFSPCIDAPPSAPDWARMAVRKVVSESRNVELFWIVLVVWVAVAVGTGFVLGRALRNADERDGADRRERPAAQHASPSHGVNS
ncbi:MAG: hypothetical protein JWQ68_1635 [Cryobacterium sp.]|jgi:hypothetical protein|nr:hypothetical protein [Cryobacterium sp.]